MYDFLEKKKDDTWGTEADSIINNVIGFVFEKLPGLSLFLAFLYLLYNLLRPAVIITSVYNF